VNFQRILFYFFCNRFELITWDITRVDTMHYELKHKFLGLFLVSPIFEADPTQCVWCCVRIVSNLYPYSICVRHEFFHVFPIFGVNTTRCVEYLTSNQYSYPSVKHGYEPRLEIPVHQSCGVVIEVVGEVKLSD